MTERLNAALEGRYRIERELGEGGMARVYLAEDLKHHRNVAVKVLRPELAAVVGAERFLSEIQTTANLQHPYILPLFDSGEADSFLFYVMPYVQGESLREKLDREKQLPIAEAVALARKVADALQYAHEKGVVHRDVKPANILLSERGEPLVADFGIALAVSQAGGGRITETGLSLGTPHYMSPEQATGDRDVDARSDVYSLGCVLYEMLAGEKPFAAPTSQAVLARILTEEPRRVTELRRTVPSHVDAVLAKSLEKLPADRFESAEAFQQALIGESYRYHPSSRAGGGAVGSRQDGGWMRDRWVRSLLAANAILLLVLLWGASASREPAPLPPPHRYLIADSLRMSPLVATSRSGDVAYQVAGGGAAWLRLRRANETRSRDIPNSTGAAAFSFSPDGEWLVLAVERGEVRKVQLATGTAVTLVPRGTLEEIYSAEWMEDGTILLAGRQGIHRVPELGGVPERLSEAPSVFARVLPGGEAVVFTSLKDFDPADASVAVLDLETGDTTIVVPVGGNPVWAPTGHLLYGHPSATVFAAPFDLDRREVIGPPVPVQENVHTLGAVSFYSLSTAGSLAYVRGSGVALTDHTTELAWMSMDGILTMLPLDPTDHGDARISPDGRQIAYTRDDQIYLFDLDRGTHQRLTFEGENHHNPVWSPDGRRLAFTSRRDDSRGAGDLYVKSVDGRSPAEWLAGMEGEQFPTTWLEDGTIVVISRVAPGSQTDILMLPPGSDDDFVPLLQAEWTELAPNLSPDGRFMAYGSDESGERHLFVRQFPDMAGRWQISTEPVEPWFVWSPEGDAIFYESASSPDLIRVDLELEPSFRVIRRTVLHDQGLIESISDIHPDGQRLLVTHDIRVGTGGQAEEEIVVVANWLSELEERVGRGGRQ